MTTKYFNRRTGNFVPGEHIEANEWHPKAAIKTMIADTYTTGDLDGDFPVVELRIRSKKIGYEFPEGTVIDKRQVGENIEYALRPRSKAKEEIYSKAKEIAKLESDIAVNYEYMTQAQMAAARERLAQLKS